MPRTVYQRIDLPVKVSLGEPDFVLLTIGPPAGFSAGVSLEWLKSGDITPSDLSWLFRNVTASVLSSDPKVPPPSERLHRVVLDIADRELAALDWETLLRDAAQKISYPAPVTPGPWTIVRRSYVRPRALTLPLTLPMRILQMNPRPYHPIADWVRSLFGHRPQTEVDEAVKVFATSAWDPPADWPTVDVLHLDVLPEILFPERLSTAHPEIVGTLGWLARSTERWQTRLLVIHCENATQAEAARKLAHALCDRGGPAMVVLYTPTPGTKPVVDFYRDFYDKLVHDFAIDHLALQSFQGADVTAAVFVGAGREEAARVSTVEIKLVELNRQLASVSEFPQTSLEYEEVFTEPSAAFQTRQILREVESDWEQSRFDIHESEGLLPLSRKLSRIREVRQSAGVVLVHKMFLPEPSPPKERFVNSSLWKPTANAPVMVEQYSDGLTQDEIYHLAIQIGPKDVRIQSIGVSPLGAIIEEVFKWSPKLQGVWVEIAVVGIDFEVLGDSVQELWLPREGSTEPVYFAVSPKKAGVAQVRFGLYYRENLIQSFRLAAIVRGAGEGERPAKEVEELAQALSVPAARIGLACYMTRMEYSRTSNLDEIEHKGRRALTLAVNKLGDRNILTVKGADVHGTQLDPDNELPDIVTQIRKALDEIAFEKIGGLKQPQYRFLGVPPNLEDLCKEALSKMAAAGWRLFTNLAPSEKLREKIRGLLDEEGIIHIAQLLRDKVIPWALVYDRSYNENLHLLSGKPVEQGVCLAALPQPGCPFQSMKCGQHADCLLNEQRQAERQAKGLPLYHERTVACPLHFWGFTQVLEAPPQQMEGESDEPQAEATVINPNGPLQLAAGLNARLALHGKHWNELTLLANNWNQPNKIADWSPPLYDNNKILDLLRTIEPDFIYFYCHARGGQVDEEKTNPPFLEFQEPDPSNPGPVRPQDFSGDPAWAHRPLVFLNACGTLGYSPDALSPFLKSLVNDRSAAGVLGTEVPVAEALAGEFAKEFILRFIGGEKAGKAVLEARRALLSRKNPLGLVYTLFAPADLTIR